MVTTSGSSEAPDTTGSTSSPSSPTSSSSAGTLAPRDVQAQLARSDSATLYLEPAQLDDAGVAALLEHDVPMHAERDYVRLKWAVRKATPDEVTMSRAFRDASSGAATPSGVTAPDAETQPLGTTPTTPGASSPVAGVSTSSGTVPEPESSESSTVSA